MKRYQYTMKRSTAAIRVDLEFAFDVKEMVDFLSNYHVEHRIGNNLVTRDFETQDLPSFGQGYYVEIFNDQPLGGWVRVPFDHYIMVTPNVMPSDTWQPPSVAIMDSLSFTSLWEREGGA